MSTTHYDIVVVGSGIVGATLVLSMAKHPLFQSSTIAIVDAAPSYPCVELDQFDPRVVALSRSSQDILCEAGVWQNIIETRACAYSKMKVWDADGTGNIEFDAAENHEDALGHIVENSVIVASLNEAITQHNQVTALRGQRVKSILKENDQQHDGHTLEFETDERVSASLIIGADGAQSKIRSLAGIRTKEWDYNHTAIVTTVKTECSHEFCAWQRFSNIGPLAFLPLSSDGEESQTSSIVWSVLTSEADKLLALDDEAFSKALGNAIEHALGRIVHVDARKAIPLRQRFAKTYIQPGLALVGDAAHTIHPLAGQGVNLGLYDVKVLVNELVRARERKIPLSDMSILRRFERQRQPHNLVTMATMEAFKRSFGSDNIALRWLRNAGLNLVDQHYFIKKVFSQVAAGNVIDV